VKFDLQFVPWRYVADWRCVRCGDCCRLYSVVIDFYEWLRIVKSFGVEHTASGLDKLFIRRRSDGSCTFLGSGGSNSLCSLQAMKPRACQLWPFKVLAKPEWGFAHEAVFSYGENRLFVYVDPMCHGLRFGSPTLEFVNGALREFVEIALGIRSFQMKTTSNVGLPSWGHFGRRLV
jgi:Fe-S-cluster containining protein